MSVENIATKTIRALKSNNLSLTPDNYAKVFCHEAKNSGSKIEDCVKLEKYFDKLSDESKKMAEGYNITTVEELIVFLISTLNRTGNLKNDDFFHAAVLLSKKLMQFLSTFPDKKISALAKQGSNLDYKHYNRVMEERDRWIELMANHKFEYLNRLDKFGYFDKTDLPNLIDEVIINLEKESDVKAVAKLMAKLLETIAKEDGAPVGELITDLRKNPDIVTSQNVIDEIKEHFNDFFYIRKKTMKKNSLDFKDAINFYTSATKAFKEKLSEQKTKISDITEKMQGEEENSFLTKLTGIAHDLHTSVEEIGKNLTQNENEVNVLKQRIEDLEANLTKEKTRSETDLLTTLLTRRKILLHAQEYEKLFQENRQNYTIVFLKPKDFEKVGDLYGRFASDTVLSSIGKFLKTKMSKVGEIGRYSGNVFLILSALDEKKITSYLTELQKKINSSKFMYETNRVEIAISFGIVNRKETNTQKAAFNRAYEVMR